jgi:hypothetical protein
MRILLLSLILGISLQGFSQQERDTVLNRCPVFITDTVSVNNFFLEFQPTTLKVYRVRGDLTVMVQQRDQFFTLFFRDKKLRNAKYKIETDPGGKYELAAKYSFRSGEQVSYVNVEKGTVDCTFDKDKNMWHLKVGGLIANLVERSVTYYKVRADLFLK